MPTSDKIVRRERMLDMILETCTDGSKHSFVRARSTCMKVDFQTSHCHVANLLWVIDRLFISRIFYELSVFFLYTCVSLYIVNCKVLNFNYPRSRVLEICEKHRTLLDPPRKPRPRPAQDPLRKIAKDRVEEQPEQSLRALARELGKVCYLFKNI